MARSANKDKIKSKNFKYGFLYLRGDVYYTCVRGVRLSTPYKKSQKESALRLLDERIIGKADKEETDGLRLSGLCEDFLKYKSLHSERLMKRYRKCFESIFTKDYRLDETNNIRDMIYEYINTTKHRQVTINRQIGYLSTLFNYAIEDGLMALNPVKRGMKKQADNERLPFSEEQIERLIIELEKQNHFRTADMIRFIKITGCRVQEVISIRLEDIDDKFLLIHGKGDKVRHFPIFYFPEILPIIEKAKKEYLTDGLLFGLKSYAKQQSNIRSARIKIKLNIEFANFHAVRKYAENDMLFNKNIPNKVVLSIIGHTADVQSKHYLLELKKKEIEGILTYKKIN